MFLAGVLTQMYWDTNPALIVILWIIAVIGDIVGLLMKVGMMVSMKTLMFLMPTMPQRPSW